METETETKPKAKRVSKKAAATAAPVEHKLRIRVRAYEHKILDLSVKQIMDTAARLDAKVVGPVPLPTEIKPHELEPTFWSDDRCENGLTKDSQENKQPPARAVVCATVTSWEKHTIRSRCGGVGLDLV